LEKDQKAQVIIEDLRFFNETTQLTKELVEEGLVFLIDKPINWTSFDVVNKLRYALRLKFGIKKLKVGHAGTLDPLATGLIIVCCGKYTKIIDHLLNESKVYTAEIKLGATTATYDAESEEFNIKSTALVDQRRIQEVIEQYKGPIQQIPPIYSAIKMNGTSAYELARKGKDVVMQPRSVEIFDLSIVNYENPFLEISTHVSKGTYIRSLAHDIGSSLGVGAYLSKLRRECIGALRMSQGLQLERVLSLING
jgi:tRNA pseudouridine55 synthase